MHYCSQEIVDVDESLLYFTSKEDLMCHINHHRTSHQSSPTFIQSNNHLSGTLASLLAGRNFDGSSWSEAACKWASEFLSTPPNQATPELGSEDKDNALIDHLVGGTPKPCSMFEIYADTKTLLAPTLKNPDMNLAANSHTSAKIPTY
jgi:hypothetical protein